MTERQPLPRPLGAIVTEHIAEDESLNASVEQIAAEAGCRPDMVKRYLHQQGIRIGQGHTTYGVRDRKKCTLISEDEILECLYRDDETFFIKKSGAKILWQGRAR